MGKTFHRKHYDKFGYGDDDFGKYKKRKKQNDRRHVRHETLDKKQSNFNMRMPDDDNEQQAEAV